MIAHWRIFGFCPLHDLVIVIDDFFYNIIRKYARNDFDYLFFYARSYYCLFFTDTGRRADQSSA